MQHTKKELVQLWANNDKRREFIKNYKDWGVWLTVPELGQTYYKYELPDGSGRFLAMEYRRENYYQLAGEGQLQTITIYYLWDGEHFIPNSASDYVLADRLKNLKTSMQKELRSETAE
jgi:hypothetical protein